MSDFLSNLVENNLNLTETITPQLPSLFAPWVNTVGRSPASHFPDPFDRNSAKEEEPFSEIGFEVPSTTQPLAMPGLIVHDLDLDSISQQYESTNPQKDLNQRPTITRNQQSAKIQRPLSSMLPNSEIVAKKTKGSITQAAQDSEHSTSFQSSTVFLESAEDQALAKSAPKKSDNNSPVQTPTTQKNEISTRSHQIMSEKQQAPLLISIKQDKVAEPLFPANEVRESILPHSIPMLNQQTIQPIVRSVVMSQYISKNIEPPNSFDHQSAERAESAPTIRVNIGRIEVRAVMPSGTSMQPQRTKSTPILSLDEYLKQRNGR